ncbi:MAG: LamG domain-containing protein [Solirubrobacteraceae bacterium]
MADHPVSYWRLNDSSGSTAVDQVGLNPGQITGATLGEPGPFAGSGSMRFEGSGDVNLGTDPSLRPPNNWTVEAWFKASASDTANCVNTYHGSGCEFYAVHAFGLHLGLDPQGHVFGAFDSTGAQGYSVESSGTYGDDTWHHIVLVRATSQLTLYVDSVEVATTAVAEPTTYYCCENIATIANDDACGCAPFTGWESEVAFYNYPLTAAQVKTHYTAAGESPPAAPQAITGAITNNSFTNGSDTVGEATLNGTAIPGTLPDKYYFQYTVGSLVLKTPSVSYSSTENVSVNTLALLPPWVKIYYQLVVTDGTQTVYGALRSFSVANQLNPPGFGFTDGSNGPGLYNVRINCQASPCSALDTHNGTPQRSIKEVGGILKITREWGSGSFEGEVTPLSGGVFVGSGSMANDSNVNTYDANYKVTGVVQLSEATLNLTVSDELAPVPPVPPFECGNSPSSRRPCGEHSVSLAGNASYPYNINGAIRPKMEGYLGGGDGWSICWQNQLDCLPPTHAAKDSANTISLATGGVALIPTPISPGLGVLSLIFGLIGADPPDSRYTHVTNLPHIGHLHISRGRLSRRAVKTVTETVNVMAQAGATGTAFLNGLQRFQGASLAGNAQWRERQAQAAVQYGHRLASECDELAALLSARHKVLTGSP